VRNGETLELHGRTHPSVSRIVQLMLDREPARRPTIARVYDMAKYLRLHSSADEIRAGPDRELNDLLGLPAPVTRAMRGTLRPREVARASRHDAPTSSEAMAADSARGLAGSLAKKSATVDAPVDANTSKLRGTLAPRRDRGADGSDRTTI
jgi:hypothetical protein